MAEADSLRLVLLIHKAAEKRRILIDLDVEKVRQEFVARVGEPMQPDAILASLHKARIIAGSSIPSILRRQSRAWLSEHGYQAPIEAS